MTPLVKLSKVRGMASFKESIIIPYSMFKSCNFEKESSLTPFREELERDVRDYKLKRQQDLLNERMYNRKPYSVHTTYVPPILPKAHTFLKDEDTLHDKPAADSDLTLTIPKILKKISIAQKPNVRSILDQIMKNHGSWNDNGEILIKGQLIKGSDISKIMQYFSKSYRLSKEPHGIKELWDFFESIKMPKSWIKNKPEHARKIPDLITLSKYPLEESEREKISEVLAKSKMSKGASVSDKLKSQMESEKLDYAGGIDPEVIDESQFDDEVLRRGSFSSTPKKSGLNIDIGEIEERPALRFGSFPPDLNPGFQIAENKSRSSKKDSPSFPERSRFGRIIKPTEKMKGKGAPLIWSPTLWSKVLKTSKY